MENSFFRFPNIDSKSFLAEKGYDTIYGDTDSLFVKLKEGEGEKAEESGNSIAAELNKYWSEKIQKEYNLKSFLNVVAPNCKIILVDKLTEGACCTTLLAEEHINNDNPLLIANSDQFMEWASGEFYHSVNSPGIDGSIITFENNHPKWSYVKCDDYGNVKELKEKEVISNEATVGIYYWSKGSDYVKYSHQMIKKDLRVNGEFYVAPVYNEAIEDGKVIKTYKIDKMWGLGTPEDLNYYLEHKK